MPSLQSVLNSAFRPTKAVRKSGTYIATNGSQSATIEKRRHQGRMLWCVEIDGRTYSNSLLGDLDAQIADLGFRVQP